MARRLIICTDCGELGPNGGHGLCRSCYARQPRRRARHRWRAMIRRCTAPADKGFPDYGGRGITVCPEWLDFDAYYAATGDAPAGMSLDRVDNDGNYEPDNVRWATRTQQAHNSRHYQRTKASCDAGHRYDEANTYRKPDGSRGCRACRRVASARHRARLAERTAA